MISGDGQGRAFFWDWKTTKIFRSFKAHEGVCIGIEWHPLESSKVGRLQCELLMNPHLATRDDAVCGQHAHRFAADLRPFHLT